MNYAIILAAGKGKRMNNKVNKILLLLNEKPIIEHAIRPFEDSILIDKIVVVASKEDIIDLDRIIRKNKFDKVKKIIEGGERRQDSVYNGIKFLEDAKEDEIVIIHNAANPFVSTSLIEEAIESAREHGACAVAVKAKDTIKEVDEDNFVTRTLDRRRLWQMQTPQAAKYRLLVKAFIKAYNDGYYGTDDVELIERLGEKVKIIECNSENFKITTLIDFENARLMMDADRVGLGLDSHKFTDKPKKLVLGGVIIPDENGIEANSDGDVILHSLFNALSQSVGGKSIGFYADALCKKGIIDSTVYLKVALDMIKERGFRINNIGIMIEAKKPIFSRYDESIKKNISNLCGIEPWQVGLTATSGEEMSAFGRGEGIQVFSIVSLRKNES